MVFKTRTVVAALVLLTLTLAGVSAWAANPARAGISRSFVLAISWEPAFCESHGRKPECRSQNATRFDASHFSLHGLWPDSNSYCGAAPSDRAADRASRWHDLPAVKLSNATRRALNAAMPGTKSLLERHEWIKHGTCSGASMEAYFASAVGFLGEVNHSPVQALFAENISKTITLAQVRRAFDAGFGRGAGARVRLSCTRAGNRRLITEITIGLSGNIISGQTLGDQNLGALIAAASPTHGGCDSGIVDAAGS